MIIKLGPNFFNLDNVRYLYANTDERGKPQIEILWHDDRLDKFAGDFTKEIEAQCGTIVAAPSGFRLKEHEDADPLPVVAFHIASNRRAIPVTPMGEPQSDAWTLLTPDGASMASDGSVAPSGKQKAPKQLPAAAE